MSQSWLKPDWAPEVCVPDLPIEHFLDMGIKALVLDVDKTLLPGRNTTLPKPIKDWVSNAQQHLSLHLLSNNPSKKRIGAVANQLGVSFTCKASKPRKASLQKVVNNLNFKPSKIAMIGDRIFTDILVGNRLGLYTVLVKPIHVDGNPYLDNQMQKIEQALVHLLGAIQP